MADQQTAESATDAAVDNDQTTSAETDEQQQTGEPDVDVKAITEALKKANREAEKYRRLAREKEQEKDREKQTDAEKISGAERDRDEARSERDEALTRLLVFEIALEKKLPADLLPLLTGKTREEIEAKADTLSRHVKPATASDFDGGARDRTPEPKTPEQAHQELLLSLLGRRGSPSQ